MRADVVRAHRALAAAGQADLVWGHVGVRDPDGRGAWMKAAGWGFEEVDEERVVLVGPDGGVVEGDGKRHLEFPIHTEILRARPDVQCVVHTHSAAATTFASLNVPMRAIDHDGVLFAEPDLPRFSRTGELLTTPELGAELAGVLGGARACLLARHGLVTAGPDLAHAVMYAVLLDRACRKQLDAMAAGGPVSWSDAAEAEAKRAQCWPASQLEAGWHYLNRIAEKGNR
ncbi:class II aldolase/adducin family protein [Amycolatopsis rhabdoformis]|uniref:Class II aldolase/adducin family protein n=1 Tax=Amycolatopsis rhabdoformis TaxID=1448059 RepID=A0ABZ1IDS9_9PSEU|nr:class II aldolase/adducin family protein [Amycolatopsis rhabdoformis]WSE32625.1 class II aldolase/adducin family protein [Amycolatopsis rhabdoformis]